MIDNQVKTMTVFDIHLNLPVKQLPNRIHAHNPLFTWFF